MFVLKIELLSSDSWPFFSLDFFHQQLPFLPSRCQLGTVPASSELGAVAVSKASEQGALMWASAAGILLFLLLSPARSAAAAVPSPPGEPESERLVCCPEWASRAARQCATARSEMLPSRGRMIYAVQGSSRVSWLFQMKWCTKPFPLLLGSPSAGALK